MGRTSRPKEVAIHSTEGAQQGRGGGEGLSAQKTQMVRGLGGRAQDLGLYPESKGGGVEGLGVCDQI